MSEGSCLVCEREVTLIGGLCGHCSSKVSGGVSDLLDDLGVDVEVIDVGEQTDGYYHIRFEAGETA